VMTGYSADKGAFDKECGVTGWIPSPRHVACQPLEQIPFKLTHIPRGGGSCGILRD
jgi:hypothetical protein